jgi:argininosuccinate synthase
VENFVVPHVQANGLYENVYLMGTAIARPCIVKNAMKIAQQENCQFVSHGATGKGNDQVRFELGFYALNPSIKMVVPWRMPEFFNRFEGRDDMIDFAKEEGIPVAHTKAKPYSTDENMYHISYESGILEDPYTAPPADMFTMTVDPMNAPDTPANLEVEFDKGVAVKVTNTDSGVTKSGVMDVFLYLNEMGSAHGVGRLDIVENRFVGIKSRGVYEAPAGTILRAAHVDLEGLTLDREVRKVRDQLSFKYAELCYNGMWFSPEMQYILESIKSAQKYTSGAVKVQLYKGNVIMKGRKSDFSLYDERMSSMQESGGYNPLDATGFIQINSIRLKADHLRNKKHD